MKNEKISLDEAQLVMSKAIRRLETIIDEGDDAKMMNAGNCLSGLISRYSKLIETRELEKRLQALEERQNLKIVN